MTLTYQGLQRLSDLEDTTLARKAGSDQDAFAELYRRHLNTVYGYIFSRTGHIQDAEDLTTQTFLSALTGISNFQGQGVFLAWLLGIARRKVADYFRNNSRTISFALDETFPYQALSPEESVEQRMQMEEIAHHLQSMLPDRAEALSLRVFGGLSSAEVARILGRSEDAVNMLVYRAMQELRQKMNGEVE